MVRDAGEIAALRALYGAASSAEEDAADALLPGLPVKRRGEPAARVLLLKGEPGAADVAAGSALDGPDGDAARSALEALGVPLDGGVLAIVTRPAAGTSAAIASERVARYLEAADPQVALALDDTARDDLAAAAGLRSLPFGELRRVRGRMLLAVDGLEASLVDDERKKRVWAQLKALKRS